MSQSKLLQCILAKKKFIIVLDDVRSTLDTQIKSVLVSEVEGSRVIITTESKNLADLVNAQFQLEVKPLKREEAKSLLLKKAFPKDKKTDFPPDIDMSATKIIEHCDGLPAAVASVGVLLSQRERVKSEWDKVADQFMWLVEHNDSFSHPKIAFELSLKYLPKYLKNCYSFCSIFPKGFIFKREELIRIWIAEGFVEQKDNTSMEEVAEDYLNDLVKFCMFEVVEKSLHGRLKRFKLQAFKHEILMLISKRQHFSIVCTDPESLNYASEARHLCLHMWSKSSRSKLDMPQLRSFMVKGGDVSEQFLHSVISSARFLMVLDLHKTGINNIPDSIGDLFNLHYLNVRKTKVSELPRTIGKLKNLQTLDVTDTELTELPSEITMLKKLRHLFVGKESDSSPVVPAPGRFRYMKDLQTLHGIGASDDFAKALEELTGLRNLSIPKVRQKHVNKLISALEKSSTLLKLEIIAMHGIQEQLNLAGIETLKSVQKLKLQGHLVEAALMHSLSYLGENLTSLCLSCTGFKDTFIKHLGKLQSLETLKLRNASNCDRLHFTAEAFLNLKKLCLLDMESIQKIIFDENGMQSLKFVALTNLPNLKEYPKNLERLKLHELRLRALHPALAEDEARVKFSKIPKLSMSSPD